MKIKFNKNCKDKYNKKIKYKKDKIYDFEEARALEILKSGYAEEYYDIPKNKKNSTE